MGACADTIECTRASLDGVTRCTARLYGPAYAPGPQAWTARHCTEQREIKSGTSDRRSARERYESAAGKTRAWFYRELF